MHDTANHNRHLQLIRSLKAVSGSQNIVQWVTFHVNECAILWIKIIKSLKSHVSSFWRHLAVELVTMKDERCLLCHPYQKPESLSIYRSIFRGYSNIYFWVFLFVAFKIITIQQRKFRLVMHLESLYRWSTSLKLHLIPRYKNLNAFVGRISKSKRPR